MTEPAPPDLLDSAGRLRRLAISLVVGAVLGGIAWTVTHQLTRDDPHNTDGAYRFIWYFTLGAFGGGFAGTLALLDHRAQQQWRRDRDMPSARIAK